MSRVIVAADFWAVHWKPSMFIDGKDFHEQREQCVEFPEVTLRVRMPRGRNSKVLRSVQYFVAGEPVAPPAYAGPGADAIAQALTRHYAAASEGAAT